MATVQLVGLRPGVAVVQKDAEPPVEMTWGLLHEAQHQEGPAGYVYRWLMLEFCRCEYEARQRRAWQSPRRDVDELVAELQARAELEEAEREGARQERRRRQDAEDRRRARDEELREVQRERARTEPDDPWWPIPHWEVPEGVRFDTPGYNQGQIVEVSFGTFGAAEAGECDPYMRVFDYSDRTGMTYRRRRVEER